MKTKTKKTTTRQQPRGTKKEEAEAAARAATREHLETLERAAVAAKVAAFDTTIEHLRALWKAKGLGDVGVIVAPKS